MADDLQTLIESCVRETVTPSDLEEAARTDRSEPELAQRVLATFTRWENEDYDEAQLRARLQELL